MDEESRWADKLERADERRRGFDFEINSKTDITGRREHCHVSKCGEEAVSRYEIKKVGSTGHGWDVQLCEDHDHEDTAWDVYNENRE